MYYKDVNLFKTQGTVDRVCSLVLGMTFAYLPESAGRRSCHDIEFGTGRPQNCILSVIFLRVWFLERGCSVLHQRASYPALG